MRREIEEGIGMLMEIIGIKSDGVVVGNKEKMVGMGDIKK